MSLIYGPQGIFDRNAEGEPLPETPPTDPPVQPPGPPQPNTYRPTPNTIYGPQGIFDRGAAGPLPNQPVNIPPTVSLSTTVTTFDDPGVVDLTATASDVDGTIEKVEFYDATTLIATVLSSPYTYSATALTAGLHTFTAKAYDNSGATATATAQAVITTAVPANVSPTVSLAATVVTAEAPGVVDLVATAADADGTIAQVEFYIDGSLVYTATGPYSYQATALTAFTHTFAVIAYDNLGATATDSEQVTIAQPHVTPPSVGRAATPQSAARVLNWANLVKKEWGDKYYEKEVVYEFGKAEFRDGAAFYD